MKDSIDDFLQHHGIKGMRWGVRRYQPYPKGEGHKGKFLGKVKKAASNSLVGQEIRSRSREISSFLSKHDMHNMSNKEIKQRVNRMALENEMKRLTPKVNKQSFSSGERLQQIKERKDYRNRGKMTDQEIRRKVERLRTKDLLNQNANKAGKDVVDAGKRIAKSLAAIGINYKAKNGSISMDDIYDALMTPDSSIAKGSTKAFTNSKLVKDLLKKTLKT